MIARTGESMPAAGNDTGWRKPTFGLIAAEQHARAGVDSTVTKARAMSAIKRIGVHLGLKPGDMLLLDSFGAFTQAQDWGRGQRPIVWASNACLMDRTGFSLSALKRHLRRLADLGLIAFHDSPNGKRWGHRDANGRIVEAYGIDLSPLAARADEFEHLFGHITAERALCQRLKRHVTVARRTLRARINAAVCAEVPGPWEKITKAFEALLAQAPKPGSSPEALERLLAAFHALLARVETAFTATSDMENAVDKTAQTQAKPTQLLPEMDPREAGSEPHIQTTREPEFVISTTQIKPAEKDTTRREHSIKPTQPRTSVPDVPNAQVIVQACPEFASWTHNMGGTLRDWASLHRAAGQLRAMIGVPDPIWGQAQAALGHQVATAALALVFEKYCNGEVASPAGYLRGMMAKAGAGELHLERSFRGRLSARAA